MVSPPFTRKSRPVTRSTWKAIAFSPGFSSCREVHGMVVAEADRLAADLRALGDREERRLARNERRGGRERGALDRLRGRCPCSSTLAGVTSSPMSMSSVATSTVWSDLLRRHLGLLAG